VVRPTLVLGQDYAFGDLAQELDSSTFTLDLSAVQNLNGQRDIHVCEGKELVLGQARQPSPNAARAAAAWSGGHGDASPWVGPSWWQEGGAPTCS